MTKKEQDEEEEYECVRCHATVKSTDKFCPKCGDNLEEELTEDNPEHEKLSLSPPLLKSVAKGGISRNFFSCLLADRAVTRYEKFVVGITLRNLFRGLLRPATASIEKGDFVVSAVTDAVAGGVPVVAAKIPVNNISEVRISPIPFDRKVRVAAVRGLIVGGLIALVIFIAVMVMNNKNQSDSVNFGGFLRYTLSIGVGIGFLSFVSILSELKRDLLQMLIVTTDNRALLLVIKGAYKEDALDVFKVNRLKVSDTAGNWQQAASTTCKKCGGIKSNRLICAKCGYVEGYKYLLIVAVILSGGVIWSSWWWNMVGYGLGFITRICTFFFVNIAVVNGLEMLYVKRRVAKGIHNVSTFNVLLALMSLVVLEVLALLLYTDMY